MIHFPIKRLAISNSGISNYSLSGTNFLVPRKNYSLYLELFRKCSPERSIHENFFLCVRTCVFSRMPFQLIFECFLFLIILCYSKNKHSFKFFLWLPSVVDFKMLERKLSVKTPNEKCKALKDIVNRLSNKDAFKK